jgi:hypothetical protein
MLLSRVILLSLVTLICCQNLFAQNRSKSAKSEAPAAESASPPAECIFAYYIQDSVGYKIPGYKAANDSFLSASKDLQKCRMMMDTITDMKLMLSRDSAVLSKGDYVLRKNEIRKRESAYNSAFAAATKKKQNAEDVLNPIRIIRNTADTIAVRRELINVMEFNQIPPMKCNPEMMMIFDITSDLIAEISKPH